MLSPYIYRKNCLRNDGTVEWLSTVLMTMHQLRMRGNIKSSDLKFAVK